MGPVLVVEDDPDQQKAVVDALRAAGFRIVASDEGGKALELAAAVAPCAVVLDLGTHGVNGWEFLRLRHEVPALSGTPVIVVTGARTDGVTADAILEKPFSVATLVATVQRLATPERPAAQASSGRAPRR
jgi:two-component system response regulator PrrA